MKNNKKKNDEEAPLGEFATVLDGDYQDFVLFEVEPVDVINSNA